MSVELVVIAPGLILLLLLVGAAGRVVEAQGHLDGAARDAARAASLAQSAPQAGQVALQAAQADLGATSWCAAGSVQAQVAGFPAAGQPAQPGDGGDRDGDLRREHEPVRPARLPPDHGLHQPGGRPAGRLHLPGAGMLTAGRPGLAGGARLGGRVHRDLRDRGGRAHRADRGRRRRHERQGTGRGHRRAGGPGRGGRHRCRRAAHAPGWPPSAPARARWPASWCSSTPAGHAAAWTR